MAEIVAAGGDFPIDADLSVFDSLHRELLAEILQRLPLKLVFACKCISKAWLSLISSAYFICCYILYHQSRNLFALYHQSKHTSYSITPRNLLGIDVVSKFPIFKSSGFSLSFLPTSESFRQPEVFHYLASSSGLVLCCTTLRVPLVYVVCNPLTKRWVYLPPPPSDTRSVRIGFVCKPHYHEDQVPETGTSFKVVRIEVVNCASPRQQLDTLRLEIFCSEMGRWTEKFFTSASSSSSSTCKRELFYRWNHQCSNAVVCDGILHWDKLSDRGVFTYDPYDAVYRTVEAPQETRRLEWCRGQCLGVSRGGLRYAHYSRADMVYRVWELEGHLGGVWSMVHAVRLDRMTPTLLLGKKFPVSLVSMHPFDGNIVYLWCGYRNGVVECNLKNGVWESPCFLQGHVPGTLSGLSFFPFVLPCWPTSVPALQQQHH